MLEILSSNQKVRFPIRDQIIESRIHIRNVPPVQQGRETGSQLMQNAIKNLFFTELN
jgi:hypothetical protein